MVRPAILRTGFAGVFAITLCCSRHQFAGAFDQTIDPSLLLRAAFDVSFSASTEASQTYAICLIDVIFQDHPARGFPKYSATPAVLVSPSYGVSARESKAFLIEGGGRPGAASAPGAVAALPAAMPLSPPCAPSLDGRRGPRAGLGARAARVLLSEDFTDLPHGYRSAAIAPLSSGADGALDHPASPRSGARPLAGAGSPCSRSPICVFIISIPAFTMTDPGVHVAVILAFP